MWVQGVGSDPLETILGCVCHLVKRLLGWVTIVFYFKVIDLLSSGSKVIVKLSTSLRLALMSSSESLLLFDG